MWQLVINYVKMNCKICRSDRNTIIEGQGVATYAKYRLFDVIENLVKTAFNQDPEFMYNSSILINLLC